MKYGMSVGLALILVLAGCSSPISPVSEDTTTGAAVPETSREALAFRLPDGRMPNVIWILLDACRARNLSCYGNDRKTSPNIDRLAERGALFERTYSQGNQTQLSVPSFMTGKYFPVYALGGGTWRERYRLPPPTEKLLPAIMRENGYRTVIVSAHPWIANSESRLWRSFEESIGAGRTFEKLVKGAVPWLAKNRDTPFFMYIHSTDTHFPHDPKPPHDRFLGKDDFLHPANKIGYPGDPAKGFTALDQRNLRGLHEGSIHYADTHIGELVAQLEELGILDSTIILITSDHGEVLGEDGKSWGHHDAITQEEVYHVPLIFAGPGIPQGRRIDALTENTDIVPTLIDLLGLETDAETDGKSLVPILYGSNPGPLHEFVLMKSRIFNHDNIPLLILQDGEDKYAFNPHTGEEHLWRVPDDTATRKDRIAKRAKALGVMRQRLKRDVMPLWRDYERLDYGRPTVFEESFWEAIMSKWVEPTDAFAYENLATPTDNKWTVLGPFGILSNPWAEDSPELTFRIPVPNGAYKVQISMDCGMKGGMPASAVAVKAENDAKVRIIKPDSPTEDGAVKNAVQYFDLGTYTIEDNAFDITIDEGDPSYWASFIALRFVLASEETEAISTEEKERLAEELKTLGYL